MSIFAFQVSQHCLHVLATRQEARDLAGEAIDAEDWLFFDAAGLPLKVQREEDGAVFLRPWASCASCSLPQVLFDVHEIRGLPPLDTLERIQRHLGL